MLRRFALRVLIWLARWLDKKDKELIVAIDDEGKAWVPLDRTRRGGSK